MVTNVMHRIERLDLAKEIIRLELKQANGPNNFSPAEVRRAAGVYLRITRHNTGRLRAKLRRLKGAGQ